MQSEVYIHPSSQHVKDWKHWSLCTDFFFIKFCHTCYPLIHWSGGAKAELNVMSPDPLARHPSGRPSCLAKTCNIGHYTQTVPPDFFILAMQHHWFVLLYTTLTDLDLALGWNLLWGWSNLNWTLSYHLTARFESRQMTGAVLIA